MTTRRSFLKIVGAVFGAAAATEVPAKYAGPIALPSEVKSVEPVFEETGKDYPVAPIRYMDLEDAGGHRMARIEPRWLGRRTRADGTVCEAWEGNAVVERTGRVDHCMMRTEGGQWRFPVSEYPSREGLVFTSATLVVGSVVTLMNVELALR